LIDSNPVGWIYRLGAAVSDPIGWLPAVGGLRAATRAQNIKRGAGTGAAFGTAAATAQEAGIQLFEPGQRNEDLFFSGVAGAALGGILGSAIGAASPTATRLGKEELKAVFQGKPSGSYSITQEGLEGSVGAARYSIDGEGLARLDGVIAKGTVFAATAGRLFESPSLRGLRSDFKTTQQLTNKLFAHDLMTNKHLYGETNGRVVETEMRLDEASLLKANREIKQAYKDYVGVQGQGLLSDIKAGISGRRTMGIDEFNIEIAKAARRGDQHSIPQIAKAAAALRKQLDDMTKALQDVGIFPEEFNLKTATSYLTRRYNVPAILSRRKDFLDILVRNFRKNNPSAEPDLLQLDAEKTLENIVGLGDQRLQLADVLNTFSEGKATNITKERSLDIPDSELEEFLINDAEYLMNTFSYQASALARLKAGLRELGYDSMGDVYKAVRDEAFEKLSAAERSNIEIDPKAAAKFQKDITKEINFIRDSVDSLLGNYAGKVPALAYLRRYQAYTLLGAVALASGPDLAMAPLKHGMGDALVHGWGASMAGLTNKKFRRAQIEEFKDMGVGIELEMNDAIRMAVDPDGGLQGPGNTVMGKIAKAGDALFGRLSLIAYWNNFGKRVAARTVSAKILRHMKKLSKGGQLDEKTISDLAQVGIGREHYAGIIRNLKNVDEYGGSFIANLNKWDDPDLVRVYQGAIQRAANNTVITPGAGDVPLWMQKSEAAKTIMQFKSFANAAVGKILIHSLQKRDANTAISLTMMVFLGAVSYNLKRITNGKEVDLDPATLLAEGVSRSGMPGVVFDYGVALNPWARVSSRFAGQNQTETIFGPTLGLTADALQVANKLARGEELTEKEKKDAMRMVPFNNLFYLRLLFNKIAEDK
jgi:hypothetical protein